ncbi:glucosyltransferase domain-containing protein, partial [Helcococcus ovis]
MFIHQKLKNWYEGLSKNIKIAFISTIIIGLICHIYMMTNKWVNLDDIVQLVDNMDRTTSGRWFLQFPAAISSEFSIPWLNGFLTIVYTAVMSCLVISMFEIKSKINTILISGILVTFPTLGSLMPFMNSQDAYQFGAMLAGLAAFFIIKYKNGFIFSSILLTLSLGIYQTYLGYAGGLIVLYVIVELFKENNNFKKMIILLCKTAISFTVALAIYLIISRGIFGHLLVDYKGLDTMGSLPLNKIHTIIFSAYKGMFNFFIGKEFNYHFIFMPYLFIFAFILTIYLLIYIVKKSKMCKEKLFLLVFLILVFPIAINIIYIMSWQA